MKRLYVIGMAMGLMALASSCSDGCKVCHGATAEKRVCRDDFQERKDFNDYIREYERQENGICED